METQTSSTAAEHALYFKEFIKSLAEKFHPLQIFCFAKSSTLNESSGCFIDEHSSYTCNYCLLLVTESNTRIDFEVQEFANRYYKQGSMIILSHSRENLENAINANDRFFITAYTTEQLIYSHDGISQCNPSVPFIPTQSAVKANRDLAHRIPLAGGFLNGAGECLSKAQFAVCTFMLHQVVEQCLITLIGAYMGYRTEFHNLVRLLGISRAFSDQPFNLLTSGGTEGQRLFDVLAKSYSGARYSDSFTVTEEDAKALYQKVADFDRLAKAMCKRKIKQLEATATRYRELHKADIETTDHQLAGELL